jgi:hypothetical protein
MKNYYVMPLQSEEYDFIWCVMERTTEQLIEAYLFKDDAIEYSKFLNNGGGFDGWTPSFILQEVVVSKNMNQEFSAFVSE